MIIRFARRNSIVPEIVEGPPTWGFGADGNVVLSLGSLGAVELTRQEVDGIGSIAIERRGYRMPEDRRQGSLGVKP
jgi:hypothetical protein